MDNLYQVKVFIRLRDELNKLRRAETTVWANLKKKLVSKVA
jgi:hypothetical protein